MLDPSSAQPSTESGQLHTAATITYNDFETFGSFKSDFEFPTNFPSSGSFSGDVSFNSVPSLEAAIGQSLSTTSLITLTIKAKPGYVLTNVSYNEGGNWATAKSGTVDVAGQDRIFDPATGNPIIATAPFVSKDPGPIGTTLTAGSWSFSDGFWDFNAPPQSEVTFDLSRTLSASGGVDGNAIIGNGSFSALSFFYTAQLIPEPSTYAALALGLIIVASVMLRKRR